MADIGHVAGTYGQSPEATDDEHELLTANYLGAILVNADGERFTDESESYKVLGSAVLAQPESMAYQVFDSVVRALSKPGVPLSDMERIEELGHLVQAPTIAALEEKLGIPTGRLERTVVASSARAAYNEGVAGRRGDPFGANRPGERRRCAGARHRAALLRVPRVTAMTSTFGGVSVGPDTSVKRIDGTRIEGLYAAGEVVGGFHGASYMTGTALTKALVFGVEAANDRATTPPALRRHTASRRSPAALRSRTRAGQCQPFASPVSRSAARIAKLVPEHARAGDHDARD